MQKNTFYGLRNVAVCVDERFRRIERISALLNKCKEFIREELENIVLKESNLNKTNLIFKVGNILKENVAEIKE